MYMDVLMVFMGAFFFFLGGRALNSGVIKTRANLQVQHWYRDKNPFVFWLFTGTYLAIGSVFVVCSLLIRFGVLQICRS